MTETTDRPRWWRMIGAILFGATIICGGWLLAVLICGPAPLPMVLLPSVVGVIAGWSAREDWA